MWRNMLVRCLFLFCSIGTSNKTSPILIVAILAFLLISGRACYFTIIFILESDNHNCSCSEQKPLRQSCLLLFTSDPLSKSTQSPLRIPQKLNCLHCLCIQDPSADHHCFRSGSFCRSLIDLASYFYFFHPLIWSVLSSRTAAIQDKLFYFGVTNNRTISVTKAGSDKLVFYKRG